MKRIVLIFLVTIKDYLNLILSTSGFVAEHVTIFRTIVMSILVSFYFYLIHFQTFNLTLSITYFVISEILYIGFIYTVLPENGYRHWFIKKWGEEKGYLIYEAILGFIFFNNGASIGYFALSTYSDILNFIPKDILVIIVTIVFSLGLIIKILAAKAVSIDIYYWKDMFLGRKICDFVVIGPYKYFNNPMYGVGQLHAYSVAILYGSIPGFFAALLNQCLVFSFYFLQEKRFIKKIYKS